MWTKLRPMPIEHHICTQEPLCRRERPQRLRKRVILTQTLRENTRPTSERQHEAAARLSSHVPPPQPPSSVKAESSGPRGRVEDNVIRTQKVARIARFGAIPLRKSVLEERIDGWR